MPCPNVVLEIPFPKCSEARNINSFPNLKLTAWSVVPRHIRCWDAAQNLGVDGNRSGYSGGGEDAAVLTVLALAALTVSMPYLLVRL
jgi:hypothetical protein